MSKNLIMTLHNIWKDIAAASVLFALIITSVIFQYNIGMLIGFLILFIFFTFDRVKRIIFDMNVKKIFGIEFGEFEKDQVKEKLSKEIERRGISLSASEIDVVTETALSQLSGVAYKSQYYEEMTLYALKDLNLTFRKNFSGSVGNDRFSVDFVVELENDRVLGIEVVYSDRRILTRDKIDQVIKTINNFKKADNLSHFVIITNTEVSENDRKILKDQNPPIDIFENIVSIDGILSRLQSHLSKIDKNRKGSLESQT